MGKKMEVAILSNVDRDIIYAELSDENEQWAEVTEGEGGTFRITIFPSVSGHPYRFELADLENALAEVRAQFRKLNDSPRRE